MFPPISWTWIIAVPLLGFAISWIQKIFPILRQIWIFNFPWGMNKYEVLSLPDTRVFGEAVEEITQLHVLGFESFAVLGVQLFYHKERIEAWFYRHSDKTILVEVVPITFSRHHKKYKAAVSFVTWFPDNACLATTYPLGETIDESNLSMHFVSEDIQLGYQYHRQFIEHWKPIHGHPIEFNTTDELVVRETAFTQLYRRRRFKRQTIGEMLKLFLSLLLIMVTSCVGIVLLWASTFDRVSVVKMLIALFFLATAYLLIFVGFEMVRGSHSAPEKALDVKK